MKQERINRAYASLIKLNEFKLPVKKAYGIYNLLKAIEEAYRFALAEEQKYLAEYHGTLKEDGSIAFPSSTDCAAFQGKVEEVCNIDVDVEIDIVTLNENDLGSQTITPADIYNLEGFVSFE
jgi:hypothetical protein